MYWLSRLVGEKVFCTMCIILTPHFKTIVIVPRKLAWSSTAEVQLHSTRLNGQGRFHNFLLPFPAAA
jgi:hypothetical protein